jgi:ADP-ribose pyrophosphatase YjhB (NUDIX family)
MINALSPISVRVRAVIHLDGGIVVTRESRGGKVHTTLPGGRVKQGESLTDALVREVMEETGLRISVEQLLYVAEVSAPNKRQDLVVIFRGEAHGTARHGEVDLVGVDAGARSVLPPILHHVREDRLESRREKNGWPAEGKWLGNVWDPVLDGA